MNTSTQSLNQNTSPGGTLISFLPRLKNFQPYHYDGWVERSGKSTI